MRRLDVVAQVGGVLVALAAGVAHVGLGPGVAVEVGLQRAALVERLRTVVTLKLEVKVARVLDLLVLLEVAHQVEHAVALVTVVSGRAVLGHVEREGGVLALEAAYLARLLAADLVRLSFVVL